MKALFVIDMLNDFIEPEGKLYIGENGKKIVPFIKDRILQFRREGKVIYICDAHSENDKEFKDWPPHAIRGSWGAGIIQDLSPLPEDIIIEKMTYDGFIGTHLEEVLKKLSIDEIYLTGVLTNICVLYTGAHAKMIGYPVKVYQNGCSSINDQKHEWALKEMEESLKIEVI